jgi:pimeloyl-ACP methyl ester carboxylesterase
MNVYFISGLGADERVFSRLKLAEQIKVHHIRWPKPSEKEGVEQYSLKVASLIDKSSEFSIVGLSFGGMVTVELLKTFKPKHAILISSVGSRQEMPNYLKLLGFTKLDNLVPSKALNRVYPLAHLFTGLKSIEDKKLWADIIRDSNPYFLKWAIHEVLNWQNELKPENVFHVHGTKDKAFPIKRIKADRVVEGGGHFMVLTHAKEISSIINQKLGYA